MAERNCCPLSCSCSSLNELVSRPELASSIIPSKVGAAVEAHHGPAAHVKVPRIPPQNGGHAVLFCCLFDLCFALCGIVRFFFVCLCAFSAFVLDRSEHEVQVRAHRDDGLCPAV
eukprot:c20626_g1_i7.p1 GENE.c20626_g1_i7~~c20626_g1_i7.p1  ORF type:complete len:115 (+),score=15.59 c20626_g1_i7:75-419(+)